MNERQVQESKYQLPNSNILSSTDIALLKKQKEMAMSGARLEALQKMVKRFRGVAKHEREAAISQAD